MVTNVSETNNDRYEELTEVVCQLNTLIQKKNPKKDEESKDMEFCSNEKSEHNNSL